MKLLLVFAIFCLKAHFLQSQSVCTLYPDGIIETFPNREIFWDMNGFFRLYDSGFVVVEGEFKTCSTGYSCVCRVRITLPKFNPPRFAEVNNCDGKPIITVNINSKATTITNKIALSLNYASSFMIGTAFTNIYIQTTLADQDNNVMVNIHPGKGLINKIEIIPSRNDVINDELSNDCSACEGFVFILNPIIDPASIQSACINALNDECFDYRIKDSKYYTEYDSLIDNCFYDASRVSTPTNCGKFDEYGKNQKDQIDSMILGAILRQFKTQTISGDAIAAINYICNCRGNKTNPDLNQQTFLKPVKLCV